MRHFLSGLILVVCLTYCPDLAAGQWHRGPTAEEQAEMDESKRERVGIYFVGIIAAIIGVVVAVQFCREAREAIPSRRTYADEVDSDY
jgi:hypothetical protein